MERKQSENESFDFRVDVLLYSCIDVLMYSTDHQRKGIKRRESEITHNM